MTDETVTADVREFAGKAYSVRLKIVGLRRFRARLWLASIAYRVGAWLSPVPTKVVIRCHL